MMLSMLGLIICGALAPAAQADITLDFALGPPQYATTELKFDGTTSDPLIGTDINVFNLSATCPSNSGLYVVRNGDLDFATGNYIDNINGQWNFGSGGSLTLSGEVGYYDASHNWQSVTGGVVTLASGTFTSAAVMGIYMPGLNYTFMVSIAGFQDDKNDALETYLGIPLTGHYLGNLNLSFYVTGNLLPGAAFDAKGSQVLSGDFINTHLPLPPSALLLGTGLVGLVGLRGRRRG
jgi:hypothetical protein